MLIFGICMGILLAAKGAALFPLSYAIDDYMLIGSPDARRAVLYLQDIQQGRFGVVLAHELLVFLGATSPLTNIFAVLLSFCTLVFCGILTCRMFRIEDRPLLSVMAISFMLIHPYQAEVFSFKHTPILLAIPYMLGFSAIYFVENTSKSLLKSILLFALTISLYQLFVNVITVILCFVVIIELYRQLTSSGNVTGNVLLENTKLLPRLLTVFLGILLYLLINKAVLHYFGTTLIERGQFIDVDKLAERFGQIYDTTMMLLFKNEPIVIASFKMLLLCLLFLLIVGIFRSALWGEPRTKKHVLWFTIPVILCAAYLSVMGVVLPIKDWTPLPRVLNAVSFFWGGCFVLAYLSGSKGMQSATICIAFLLLFGFAGMNNRIFTDQMRVNMRDFHKANRIIARLENSPEFHNVQRLAIVGGHLNDASPISTQQGDLNVSAFIKSWANVNLINEVSGYRFGEASPNEKMRAYQYCMYTPNTANTVVVQGNLGVICNE